MVSFYFTLLAVLIAGLGARDQVAIARITLRQGKRLGVLLAGIAVSIATAAFAAWASTYIAPTLAPRARVFLAALALGFAGVEALLLVARRNPEEPTHSLGALTIVLLALQLTDAARFVVFGIAVGTNAPIPAGIAGALGGSVLLAAGWLMPEGASHRRVAVLRRVLGAGMLLLALFLGLRAIGRI